MTSDKFIKENRGVVLLIAILLLSIVIFYIPSNDASALSIKAYTPFKIEIKNIKVYGQLRFEEKDGLFLLKKVNSLILVIPKYGDADEGLTFRHKEGFYGAFTIENTIELISDNPKVLLCYFINPYEANQKYECKTEIRTNVAKIGIKPQELSNLVKSSGVTDQEIKANLLDFNLDGKIDNENFSIQGSVLYDNTVESKGSYQQKVSETAKSFQRGNAILYYGIKLLLVVLIVSVLYFVLRFFLKRKRSI